MRAAPTILSAANEIAVAAFLERRIGFLDIAALVEAVMDALGAPSVETLASVLELDEEARAMCRRAIDQGKARGSAPGPRWG